MDTNAVNVEVEPEARPSSPPPPLGRGLLVAIGSLVVITWLGAALVVPLSVHYPLLLIALNPWPRHIILVAPTTPIEWLVPIAALRGLCACIVSFEVGRRYGPQGIRIIERRSAGLGRFVRLAERVFGWVGPLVVFVFPSPLTSSLAAVAGTSRALTLTLSLLGFAAWAYIYHRVGDLLAPYTEAILGFFKRNMVEATLACILLVVGYQWIARKRRLAKADS